MTRDGLPTPANPDLGLIIVAAGSGARLGAEVPKALVTLAGRSLLQWCLELLAPAAGAVVVVAPPTHVDVVTELVAVVMGTRAAVVVAGGDTRQESVAAGLAALASPCSLVAIHDAARPLVDGGALDRAVGAISAGAAAAAPAVAVTDTIKVVGPTGERVQSTLDRATLRAVQTPQVFQRDVLVRAHRMQTDPQATDDLALVEQSGATVVLVAGSPRYVKITHPEDMLFAQAMITDLDPIRAAVTST